MVVTLEKAPTILPVIVSDRPTYLGHQYTVASTAFIDTVLVNGTNITCTCGEADCQHIQAVQDLRAANAVTDAHRVAYTELFDLSYGYNY